MKRMNKKVKINGRIVEVTTISGLANIVGRSRPTILRWEREDIIPPAPIMLGSYRYYPLTYCKDVANIVKGFLPNKAPSADLIVQLNKLYKEEVEKYA